MTPLRGCCRSQQGNGPFPSQDRRPLRAMIARQDKRESLPDLLNRPLFLERRHAHPQASKFPWEFVQIGNLRRSDRVGRGLALLIHGVGPVRKYAIGAVLLDLSDPSKVLGRSSEPARSPRANPNAKGMCPMSSIPAERCAKAPGSSCPSPCRTHFRPLGLIEIDALPEDASRS